MQVNTFLPETLEGWLTVLTVVGGATFTVWKTQRSATEKINGLGKRTKTVEEAITRLGAEMAHLQTGHQIATSDRANLHERIGALSKNTEGLHDQIRDARIELGAQMSELKNLVQQDASRVRERVVRIETIVEIERKLGRPLTELEKS